MNYWYAPLNDSQAHVTPRLPPELISAVAAPWRSTKELEAIRVKARNQAHYDMAAAAQSVLTSRKKQESKGAVKALRHGQLLHQLHTDTAALEALTAVDAMWAVHLDELRREACAAVRTLQEKHEDALTKLRLDQVARAHERGVRPERRSKELLNLRRSEAVLASRNDFSGAAKVQAHADELAASEACGAHASWLLKCHGEQERLLSRQRRELEALRKRLDARLREVEVARDRDLDKLQRKIKASGSQQQRSFAQERQFLEQALQGDLLNTTSTRPGRSLRDALPTLAEMAATRQQQQEQAGSGTGSPSPSAQQQQQPGDSTPGTGYLGPSSASREPAGRPPRSEGPGGGGPGVRFAPTPPRREAWGLAGSGKDGSGSENGSRACSSGSGSGREQSRPSTSSSSSGTTNSGSGGSRARGRASGSWSHESVDGEAGQPPRPPTAGAERPATGAADAAPASAAAGSGTTAAATGSGSSALTEEALRAMNQAAGARLTDMHRGASSLQSSSFKSNKPYAGGISARAIAKPVP